MLEKSEEAVSSAQPASKEFQNKYEYLTTHYSSAIGIHLSQGLSGTYSSSDKGARDVMERTDKKISVINSKTLTGALGLILLRAAEAIEAGASHDEVVAKVNEWVGKCQIRVSLTTLKYIVRSGRVSPFKSFVAKLLDLKPVIVLDHEGKAILYQKSFTEKASMKKIIRGIKKISASGRIWNYTITHANNPATANWFATEMEKLTGRKPLFIDHASPALVANTGPGVTCISYLME
jgi:DegV family protein with EDD domain